MAKVTTTTARVQWSSAGHRYLKDFDSADAAKEFFEALVKKTSTFRATVSLAYSYERAD